MPPFHDRDPKSKWVVNWGPPRHSRNLVVADIGAADLFPAYASAMRISVAATATVPLTICYVPIAENDDAMTADIVITTYGDRWEPISLRRIVSINGATGAIPVGVSILLGWG